MYYPQLILDNIQFSFDENGTLHIKFVNLKVAVYGNYKYGIGFAQIVNEFYAALNNLSWEMLFSVSKEELEDGKLDLTFKQIATSAFKYDLNLFANNANNIEMKNLNISVSVEDSLKELLKQNIGYFTLTNQLKKVALLILTTIESDLE